MDAVGPGLASSFSVPGQGRTWRGPDREDSYECSGAGML